MSMCVTQCHTVSHSVYVSMHVPARMSVCVCVHMCCVLGMRMYAQVLVSMSCYFVCPFVASPFVADASDKQESLDQTQHAAPMWTFSHKKPPAILDCNDSMQQDAPCIALCRARAPARSSASR